MIEEVFILIINEKIILTYNCFKINNNASVILNKFSNISLKSLKIIIINKIRVYFISVIITKYLDNRLIDTTK